MNIYVSMTQTSLFDEYNMCRWHRLVSDLSWYVPMTRYRIFDEYVCQWHRFVYSMNIFVCQWHENGYSVNICVSMTRNGIIRQCRKIDQVLFLLFVTVYANHTMYGWFRWSFAMQKCPPWGEIRWSSVYRGSWLPWTRLMSRSPVLSDAHHKNWFYNI